MCGIVGVIGDLWLREKKVFDFLLKLDIVRGPHSTGVARIKMEGEAELIKGVGTTWHLIHDKPNEYYNTDQPKGIIEGNFKALMGHNRWATVGAVNEENAHPFTQGSITGAHNGTLDQYALNYRLEDSEKFGTDSECIMHNINIFGAEKTIGKMSGAWALTWYDRDEDTFNIIRNKERPLHFAWDKSGRSFFYASEDWMLAAAFERYDVEVENIWSLPSDTLYKFDMSTPITKFGQDRRTKTEMKGWTPPKYTHTPNHTNYGNNVSPFPRARNYSDRELALEMEKKIGSFVDFCVSSLRRDENNQEYVSGYVWNKPDVEIRVYETNRNSDLFMMLDDANIDEYYGKVKKVKTTARGVYLTLEHDSIGHIEWTADSNNRITVDKISAVLDDTIPFDDADVEDGDDFIVGFGEQEVTELEYYRQVEHGCAWCSIVPPVEDCHDLKWMDRQTFLCADCCDDQYVAAEVLTK